MIPTPRDPIATVKLISVTYRLTADLADGLKKEASKRKTSQSAILRGLLNEFLKGERK